MSTPDARRIELLEAQVASLQTKYDMAVYTIALLRHKNGELKQLADQLTTVSQNSLALIEQTRREFEHAATKRS